MEWWHVYLFTRLDGVNTVLTLGFLGMIAVMGFTFLIPILECPVTVIRHWPKYVAGAVVYTILCLAIPTQKEAAAIYLLPKLANSDFAKEAGNLPTDAAKLMRLKLEAWIADMEPKAVK